MVHVQTRVRQNDARDVAFGLLLGRHDDRIARMFDGITVLGAEDGGLGICGIDVDDLVGDAHRGEGIENTLLGSVTHGAPQRLEVDANQRITILHRAPRPLPSAVAVFGSGSLAIRAWRPARARCSEAPRLGCTRPAARATARRQSTGKNRALRAGESRLGRRQDQAARGCELGSATCGCSSTTFGVSLMAMRICTVAAPRAKNVHM